MSTSTIERTCAHGMIESECAYCAYPALVIESESERTARTAARLASSMRAAIRKHERERDLVRGYALITRSMLDAFESSARAAARPYGGDTAGTFERSLDSFAVWLARQDRERIEQVRTDTRYVRALARKIADRKARRAGTGRGSMPRLKVGEHAPECERGECVTYCGAVMVDNALRGLTVRTYHAVSVIGINAPLLDAALSTRAHDRPLSESERAAVVDTLDYERVPGAPSYPRWLDAFGESAPNVGHAHPFGHRAPGIPERDSASTRRASMIESARALNLNWELLRAALERVRRTRRGFAVDTRSIAADTGDTRHVSNVRRDLVAMLERIESIDRDSIDAPIPAPVLAQARPMLARHECTSSECERVHATPIIESTYRGGIQLRPDAPTIYPVEHEHVRTVIERALDGSIIESEYTYPASECTYCQAWRAVLDSSASSAVSWDTVRAT